MAGRTGTVKKDNSGKWRWRYNVAPPGTKAKWKSGRGFDRRGDAVAAMNVVIEQVGQDRARPLAHDRVETVSSYAKLWLASLRTRGLAVATISCYQGSLERYVVPAIGEVDLGDVMPLHFDELYAQMAAAASERTGKPLSARTIRLTHTICHKMFADAVKQRLIRSNPVDDASPPSSRAARAPEAKVWTHEQLRAFLADTAGHGHHILWTVAAWTGLRRGELAALRWDAVDLESHKIRVVASAGIDRERGLIETTEPKTDRSRRVVEIDGSTNQLLREHKLRQAELRLMAGPTWVGEGWVFCEPIDGSQLHPQKITDAFRRAVKRSELPPIKLHDLRHTYATIMLRAGASPKVVSELLGHASVSFTLDVYGHVMPGDQRQAVELFAAKMMDLG